MMAAKREPASPASKPCRQAGQDLLLVDIDFVISIDR